MTAGAVMPEHIMRIELIDSLAGFQALRGAWLEIYAQDPEAQFFLSWDWLLGALQAHPGEWLVLAARGDGDHYLGLLPLRCKTVWSASRRQLCNELHFAGRFFWSDYGGLLCRPGVEHEVVPALAGFVKQLSWSHFHLKGFRVSDERLALFMAPLRDPRLRTRSLTHVINGGEVDNLVCPYVELPQTFDEFLEQRLSANTRQKVRRYLRKVEASAEYRITAATPATQARDLDALQALWSTMWTARKGGKAERQARKYREIVQQGLERGFASVTVLWHRERPVAALASLIDRTKSRLLFFIGGRDRDFDDVPAGLLLHACNIRWAIGQGLRVYDFLRGNEPYKYSFGAADVRIHYPLVQTRTGTNLHGQLASHGVEQAVQIARQLVRAQRAQDATRACEQILAASPQQAAAQRLLRSVRTRGPAAQGPSRRSASAAFAAADGGGDP